MCTTCDPSTDAIALLQRAHEAFDTERSRAHVLACTVRCLERHVESLEQSRDEERGYAESMRLHAERLQTRLDAEEASVRALTKQLSEKDAEIAAQRERLAAERRDFGESMRREHDEHTRRVRDLSQRADKATASAEKATANAQRMTSKLEKQMLEMKDLQERVKAAETRSVPELQRMADEMQKLTTSFADAKCDLLLREAEVQRLTAMVCDEPKFNESVASYIARANEIRASTVGPAGALTTIAKMAVAPVNAASDARNALEDARALVDKAFTAFVLLQGGREAFFGDPTAAARDRAAVMFDNVRDRIDRSFAETQSTLERIRKTATDAKRAIIELVTTANHGVARFAACAPLLDALMGEDATFRLAHTIMANVANDMPEDTPQNQTIKQVMQLACRHFEDATKRYDAVSERLPPQGTDRLDLIDRTRRQA